MTASCPKCASSSVWCNVLYRAAGVSINWNCQLPLLSALASPPATPSTAAAAGVHEVTLAAHGRKAGAGRKASNWSNKKTQSRLCSAALHEQWRQLLAVLPELQAAAQSGTACDALEESAGNGFSAQQRDGAQGPGGMELDIQLYRAEKQRTGQHYQQVWKALRQAPSAFAGWIRKW